MFVRIDYYRVRLCNSCKGLRGIVPKIYDPKLADEDLPIATEDAYKMAKRLAREEGLLVGISAAAAVVGSVKIAETCKKGQPAVIVTILCDSGDKYLSERFWTEA